MNLIIFGATGSIGQHLITKALDQGHTVKAFARHAFNLKTSHPNLILISGDVFDQQSVSNAVKGCDAVLITLGSAKLTGKVRSIGTLNIVNAMQFHNVKRLICQTTLGAGDSHAVLNFYWKYIMFGLILRSVFKDHEDQEEIVKESNLDWTIVRPAAFTDGPATDSYNHGLSVLNKDQKLKISRLDVASFMIDQIKDDTYLHQYPGISY